MPWIRIFAKANPDEWEGNWDVVLDVLLDNDNTIKAGINFFGICGGFESNSVMPFLLRHDGDVDFGCAVGPEETQFSRMNIHERSMRVGEYFTHYHETDEVVLRIVQLTNLTES
jgi:hypothetical protein